MQSLTRREMLTTTAAVGGWMALGMDTAMAQPTRRGATPSEGPYSLPPLSYGYADLEPHIDAMTMKLHHDIHHAGYVRGANAATAELAAISRSGGEDMGKVRALTESLSFNLSGHLLHTIFWRNMSKSGGGAPSDGCDLTGMMKRDFGGVDSGWNQFAAAAGQVQGSGWGILAFEPHAKRLMVLQAEKHQNLGVWGVVPLLVVDVWEHAYYLNYQNKRAGYINAFRHVIDWNDVDARLRAAMRG